MAELEARTPFAGLLPVRAAEMVLAEAAPARITSLMPGPGQEEALGSALKAAHGLGWPGPGRAVLGEGAAVVWTGIGQAMLMGPAPDEALAAHAALTDQSDAWAVAELTGAAGPEALARLVPVDLRPRAFPEGHAARTLIGHMHGAVWRTGPEALRLMVFRSMARTLAHEVQVAMDAVAARLDEAARPR